MLLLVSGALLLTFGWMLAGGGVAANAETKPSDKAAVVNGQVISMQEVQAKATEALDELDLQHQQLEVQFQQARQKALRTALDQLIEDRLLDLEAKATGKTKEVLVAEGTKAKATPVTDAEIDEFYAQLQKQRPQGLPPKEGIAAQIKTHLQQQKDEGARQAFFDGLRTKYKVEAFIDEPRLAIETEGHPAKGPTTAPVTIVEFSDFECPYCSQVVPTLRQIEEHYGDKVRLVFRQFPLNIHPHARKAAEAALCANEQGKFWEMHDAMFGDQKALEVADLKKKAQTVGLDATKFDTCLDNSKFAPDVKKDERAGVLVGVNGTPAMFINGRLLSGAQPYEALASVIDEELAKAAKNGKS
ncbi:MAG TPA: thioredoxin domain-containing protein [Thermoanaerobaculia bacterium]|nr:thioredoxin domain-containing protein [Thermoanaerobaculia bacterium]